MRKISQIGRFILFLLTNMLLHLEWTIPAWVLLALHFWLGISIKWFIGALAFWIICRIVDMWFIDWAVFCGSQKDPPKENKNPYSKKQ